MPIDTILLDLGNVLVAVDFDRGARRLAALAGCAPERVRPHLTGRELYDLDAGRLSPERFFEGINARLGAHVPFDACCEAWCDLFSVEEQMVRTAERLAARYRVYLWSNTDPLHFGHLRPRLPELDRFAGLHLSYELGAAKPELPFYERAIDRGGLEPSRCLFVDDVPANLEPARALGIRTVLHLDPARTLHALADHGIETGP